MKVQQFDTDAEAKLLAVFMLDDSGMILNETVGEGMLADWFWDAKHQAVFTAMLTLFRAGKHPEEVGLADELKRSGELEQIGGRSFVYELSKRAEVTAHHENFRDIIREKYFLRRTLRLSALIGEKAGKADAESSALIDLIEREAFELRTKRSANTVKSCRDLREEISSTINFMVENRGRMIGLPTGITDLDGLTRGFTGSQMIVVAARPGMGKTSIALNFIEAVMFSPQVREGLERRTLFFSLEMKAAELAQRLYASRAGVSWRKIADGFASASMIAQVHAARDEFEKTPLLIDDAGGRNIYEIRAVARREHGRAPLGMIVIDYIQLMNGVDPKQPREQQISEASRMIKALSKELDIPVIALAQLNRESEKEARDPRLDDLRESGAIEQDADMVIFIARDKPKEKEEESGQFTRRKLILAKNRSGPTGDTPVHFNRALTKFTSVANV
jgi:replicative DNA helicase